MRFSSTENHIRKIPEPQPSGPTTALFNLYLRYNSPHRWVHAGKVEGHLPPTRFSAWARRSRARRDETYALSRVKRGAGSHGGIIDGFREASISSEPLFDME